MADKIYETKMECPCCNHMITIEINVSKIKEQEMTLLEEEV